jgi:hypothetical protein
MYLILKEYPPEVRFFLSPSSHPEEQMEEKNKTCCYNIRENHLTKSHLT